MDLREPRFREAILNLAADLHGRPKDELDGEDLQNRKLRRIRRLAVGGLVALTVAAMAAAAVAVVPSAPRHVPQERRATAEGEGDDGGGRRAASKRSPKRVSSLPDRARWTSRLSDSSWRLRPSSARPSRPGRRSTPTSQACRRTATRPSRRWESR